MSWIEKIRGGFPSFNILSAILMAQRYPLLAMALIVVWAPACGISPATAIAGNTRLLESYLQLFMLTTITLVALVFMESIRRLAQARTEKDVVGSSGSGGTKWTWYPYVILSIGAFVSPLTCWLYTRAQALDSSGLETAGREWSFGDWCKMECRGWVIFDWPAALATIGIGIAFGWMFMMLLGIMRSFLLGSEEDSANYFPFEARTQKGWLEKWKWVAQCPDSAVDLQLFFYVGVLVIGFLFGLRPFESQVNLWILSIPAYLTFLIWGSTMVLAGIAAFFQKSRLPILTIVFISVFAIQYFVEPKAVFRTVPPKHERVFARLVQEHQRYSREMRTTSESVIDQNALKGSSLVKSVEEIDKTAWQAIKSRMSKSNLNGNRRTLVIITCPGGGIHAAVWSAYVLEQLEKRYKNFRNSVTLISGVSGGSVGTMFYCGDAFLPNGAAKNTTIGSKIASDSCLEAIGAGLAFDDGPGLLFPFMVRLDRGERLEAAWHSRSPYLKTASFDEWGQRALEGEMPIVILNSTDAASGRRVQFSTIPSPIRQSMLRSPSRTINHRELIASDELDVLVSSGARASATFPYASPFIKPDKPSSFEPAIALGDGGYVDNEGIVTAIEWIDFLASKNTAEAKVFDRILLIRIQPAVVDFSAPEASRVVSSLRWLTGPLEALANMRSTSQVERGELEVDVGTQYIESPWWKKSENVPTTTSNVAPAIEPDETDVSNAKIFSKDAQKLNKAVQRGARIESIKQASKQTKPDQQGTNSKPGTGDAIPQAFTGDRIESLVDLPVVEVLMPFLIEDVELPLNWKLSEKQKLVYPKAWQELLNGITLPENERYSYFAELDKIFGEPDEAVKPKFDGK